MQADYIHILRRGTWSRDASGAVPHGGHIEMSAFAAEYDVTVEAYDTDFELRDPRPRCTS